MTTSDERRRSIGWADPMGAARWAGRVSGMEFFAKLQSGEIPPPPISATLGMDLDLVEEGRVVFSLEPAEYHYNPIGVVHGGVIATGIDVVLLQAVRSVCGVDDRQTTVETKLNYLKAVTGTTLSFTGKALRVGGRTGVAEGAAYDEVGDCVAVALGTIAIHRHRAKVPPA